MREDEASVSKKIRTMPTDPARIRRSDPGDPDKCPVWPLHQVYSSEDTKQWVMQGCKSAGIGCIECKQPVIDAVLELSLIHISGISRTSSSMPQKQPPAR